MNASRHPSKSLVSAAAAVIVLAGLVTSADAAHATPRAHAAIAASYETAPCLVEVPVVQRDRIRCGYLTVPERRGEGVDPTRTLRLPVVIVPATSPTPALDPLVVAFADEPGGDTVAELDHIVEQFDWATADRDVILVEQRGGPLAEPSLSCPELGLEEFVDDGEVLVGDAADARRLRQLQRCRDRLVENGVDPSAYTSAASAADLADLRVALGYAEWNLYSRSFGTRIALTTMRDHADGLRSVILDGPYPPHIHRYEAAPLALRDAVSNLLIRCGETPTCRDTYPDLAEHLADVLDRVAADPLAVDATDPTSGAELRVTWSDADLLDAIAVSLSDADSARAVPFIVEQLARDNDSAALPLAESWLAAFDSGASGLAYSLDCTEEVPFADDGRLAEALMSDPLLAHVDPAPIPRDACAIWAVPSAGANEYAVVVSSIPTLLTTGGLDPRTPRAWAAATAEGLSLSTAIDFANMGHGPVWESAADACAAAVAASFLTDPSAPPSAPCIGRAASTRFATTADLDATTAVHRLERDLLRHRDAAQTGIALGLLALVGLAFLYGVGYGLLWLARRRRGDAPEGAVLASTVAAGSLLLFSAGIVALIALSDSVTRSLGIPAGAWPVVILPFVALASTGVLIALLVRAWLTGDGSTGHRVVLSASAIAYVGMIAWLVARGLLLL